MPEIDISTYIPPFDVLVMKDTLYGFVAMLFIGDTKVKKTKRSTRRRP